MYLVLQEFSFQKIIGGLAGKHRISRVAVHFYQIVSRIALFLQEIQYSVNIQTAGSQGRKAVIIQILQVNKGDAVIIFLTIVRGSPPPAARCARSGQILMDVSANSRSTCSGASAIEPRWG